MKYLLYDLLNRDRRAGCAVCAYVCRGCGEEGMWTRRIIAFGTDHGVGYGGYEGCESPTLDVVCLGCRLPSSVAYVGRYEVRSTT